MPRPLSPFDLDDAIRRYAAGETSREIAASIGIDRGTLDRKLRAAGIAPQRSGAWIDEAIRLYGEGLNQREIGERLGHPQAVVSAALARRGVQTISRSEAMSRRLARMTAAERAELAAAANAAVRGSTKTEQAMINAAIGRQRTQSGGTDDERAIMEALAELGIYGVTQQAVGKYNLDIGAHPVAVELFGGGWHAHGRHRARLPQRVKDLADAGWNLLIAWTCAVHPLSPTLVAQNVAAYLDRSRRDPTFRRQYRVIWGDGQFIAAGGVDDDQLTLIPTGIRGTYARRR